MSEKSGDEPKKNSILHELLGVAAKEAANTKPAEPKKNPKLDDAISRLLRRKAPADGQEGDDSVH